MGSDIPLPSFWIHLVSVRAHYCKVCSAQARSWFVTPFGHCLHCPTCSLHFPPPDPAPTSSLLRSPLSWVCCMKMLVTGAKMEIFSRHQDTVEVWWLSDVSDHLVQNLQKKKIFLQVSHSHPFETHREREQERKREREQEQGEGVWSSWCEHGCHMQDPHPLPHTWRCLWLSTSCRRARERPSKISLEVLVWETPLLCLMLWVP